MEEGIWIGQGGKQYGPYSEADVRRWQAEGRFGSDAVAWRKGMPDWVPLATLLGTHTGSAMPPPVAPPPMAPPPPAWSAQATPAHDPGAAMAGAWAARRHGHEEAHDDRNSLPSPPALHWGLVLLFTVLTLGIFGIVWPFIQASWVRKIDRESKATMLLGLALGCWIFGYALILGGAASAGSEARSPGLVGLGLLLVLAYPVLFVVGYFSMAESIRRRMSRYQVPVEIGGVTLFFFNVWYMQAQLSWVARWQRTGQTHPQATKGAFWALFLAFPFVTGVLAAIAIPAYQDYVMRSQVASVLSQADVLKVQITEAVGSNRAWPASNAQAGLREPDEYANGNLAGFAVQAVEDGTALVASFSDHAPVALRSKRLTLVAHAQGGAIVWSCASPDINQRYLPVQCR